MTDPRKQPGQQGNQEQLDRDRELERKRQDQGGDLSEADRQAGKSPRRGQEESIPSRTDTETEGDTENNPGRQNAG